MQSILVLTFCQIDLDPVFKGSAMPSRNSPVLRAACRFPQPAGGAPSRGEGTDIRQRRDSEGSAGSARPRWGFVAEGC